jgi:ubiquinone biosynthesis monooxygenase Coq7
MFVFAAVQAERAYPGWLTSDLRGNHAGEVAAVELCRGALAATRCPALQAQIHDHFRTERRHVALIEAILDPTAHSRLMPVWRFLGRAVGFLSCAISARFYHRTMEGVESFADRHYEKQIQRLHALRGHRELRRVLEVCRGDEIRHRAEAADGAGRPAGLPGQLWWRVVTIGSAAAIAVARRF